MKKKPAARKSAVRNSVAKKSTSLAKAKPDGLGSLIAEVRQLIQSARRGVSSVIDTFQVMTNFEIGRRIVEHEQKGERRAAYGAELLKVLCSSAIDVGMMISRLLLTDGQGLGQQGLGGVHDFHVVLIRARSRDHVHHFLDHIDVRHGDVAVAVGHRMIRFEQAFHRRRIFDHAAHAYAGVLRPAHVLSGENHLPGFVCGAIRTGGAVRVGQVARHYIEPLRLGGHGRGGDVEYFQQRGHDGLPLNGREHHADAMRQHGNVGFVMHDVLGKLGALDIHVHRVSVEGWLQRASVQQFGLRQRL